MKVNRGELINWMKRENEVLTDELQTLLDRCLETVGEEHLRLIRSIYSGLERGFPRLLWTLDGSRFETNPNSPHIEECNWCVDLPMEEAHLCPKCWGTGVVKDGGMIAIEVDRHFLFNPLRAHRR